MQTSLNQRKPKRSPKSFLRLGAALLVYALLIFSTPPVLSAAVFQIPAGDVPGLIAAINTANANGEENTINLEPGTYTLTTINNEDFGPSGLPSIIGEININGGNAKPTIIERDENAPGFRIIHIEDSGKLSINGLTIRGGGVDVRPGGAGGGIANGGTLTVTQSVIARNSANAGGAIVNFNTARVIDSTLNLNNGLVLGGGVFNQSGTFTIDNSTINENAAPEGGGLFNNPNSTITIMNSTISNNVATGFAGGGIENIGTLKITNSTISRNQAAPGLEGGGIFNGETGTVELRNTILALNFTFLGPDCRDETPAVGPIVSLGNNIIGDLSGCTITLLPSDLTGEPGLGDFLDDGAPGNGRFPLLSGSKAIDAGNDSACLPADQLAIPRNGPCDIGAIEFYPVVNNLVALANITTAFDPSPVPDGPAGVFRITANFANTSNQAIIHPFVEVLELTGGNLLLNADGGTGGVGARLTLSDSATTPLEPGASSTFEFLIGLQQQEPFTFFVNMLGEPQTSNPSVAVRTHGTPAALGRRELCKRA